jgi:F0F1-type ATP synthase gamma subunit
VLLNENRKTSEITLAIAGSKGAAGLRRDFVKQFHTNVQELGKKALSFVDVEPLVEILDEISEYDKVRIISNQWESVVTSNIVHRLLPNPNNMVDEVRYSSSP